MRGNDDLDLRRTELLAAALGGHVEVAGYIIRACKSQHASNAVLGAQLVGACVEELGTLWTMDRCSFTEVTLAAGILKNAYRIACPASEAALAPGAASPLRRADGQTLRVVLCVVPGEQHTVGIELIADTFREHGCDVDLVYPRDALDIGGDLRVGAGRPDRAAQGTLEAALLRSTPDVVGLSLGSARRWRAAARIIRHVHDVLTQDVAQWAVDAEEAVRSPLVLLGGQAINQQPELAHRIGGVHAHDTEDALAIVALHCARESEIGLTGSLPADMAQHWTGA